MMPQGFATYDAVTDGHYFFAQQAKVGFWACVFRPEHVYDSTLALNGTGSNL